MMLVLLLVFGGCCYFLPSCTESVVRLLLCVCQAWMRVTMQVRSGNEGKQICGERISYLPQFSTRQQSYLVCGICQTVFARLVAHFNTVVWCTRKKKVLCKCSGYVKQQLRVFTGGNVGVCMFVFNFDSLKQCK